MYVVGLAGGIGSGKTTVSDRFGELGVTVADADVASRTIVEPGRPALTEIVNRYGTDILQPDGFLDRARLRSIVFADRSERRWLEHLTHGPINAELKYVMESASSSYSILVLSAGSGRSKIMNRVLVVDVPPTLQLARVTSRDHNSAEQVQAIMDAQPSRQERLDIADDILINDSSLEKLLQDVDKLHAQYKDLSNK